MKYKQYTTQDILNLFEKIRKLSDKLVKQAKDD